MDMLHLRNFKDFILLYNQISETCFKRCMNTLFSREISVDEDVCLSKCLEKHINGNHKMMEIFMEIQPILVQKRIEEVQKAQAALESQIEVQKAES
ncbi:mitochondrial import inner membrane translocase subunit Tim10 B-like [Hylaeus volcanicus]|uniref:mitochondrial import inner membrane translocase subunit Tim10 B-like n=1 Tax=Hylaeus volcanicus TaxID=313075 RepID=UPI0023B874AD|nr:mitochondrial import inner membrane translocase subunit Tim10 B-like [Hylaeus volcanicus]